jgi:hypothetical protein
VPPPWRKHTKISNTSPMCLPMICGAAHECVGVSQGTPVGV